MNELDFGKEILHGSSRVLEDIHVIGNQSRDFLDIHIGLPLHVIDHFHKDQAEVTSLVVFDMMDPLESTAESFID